MACMINGRLAAWLQAVAISTRALVGCWRNGVSALNRLSVLSGNVGKRWYNKSRRKRRIEKKVHNSNIVYIVMARITFGCQCTINC